MKKEKIKPTKKKILTYYLILASCLLVAAAITVGVVFGVKKNNPTIDKPPVANPDDSNKPDNPDKPDKPVDTTTAYEFIVPVKDVNLTQSYVFGYDKTLDRYTEHKGMDFAAAAGTEVLAAVDGTIENVYTQDQLYGAVIEIKHENGFMTVYKFVTPAENLKKGDKVNRGDVIGTIAAATGVEIQDGDHLHFEVFENGKRIDPDLKLNIISK